MRTDDKGYVIRSVNLFDGSVYYRGTDGRSQLSKETIPVQKTYTSIGAKIAVTNLRNKSSSDTDYCIERLDAYYFPTDKTFSVSINAIDRGLKRCDELVEGNDFDRGDKMRINDIRKILTNLKTEKLQEQ